jgi:clan AA aspartic protease
MIFGTVNPYREAIVQFVVIGKNQKRKSIKAVIDTGYSGSLILPLEIIEELELTRYATQEGVLGNGAVHQFSVHEGSVIWDGKVQAIEINSAEAGPLVGMGLLEGYEVRIEAVTGGDVRIQLLSDR